MHNLLGGGEPLKFVEGGQQRIGNGGPRCGLCLRFGSGPRGAHSHRCIAAEEEAFSSSGIGGWDELLQSPFGGHTRRHRDGSGGRLSIGNIHSRTVVVVVVGC